ncbi:hypothetical protein LguiA_000676 [Lonicera macranthoides]
MAEKRRWPEMEVDREDCDAERQDGRREKYISAAFSTSSLLNRANCKDMAWLKNVGLLNVQVISRQSLVLH